MIFLCLRHWVHNYHVDGFRFDLASILSRDRNGELVPNPPVVEAIAEDPLLADTKIIAEAWDAAGAYQVGSFAQSALGRMERPLSRRHPPLLARRLGHDRAAGHAAGRLERSLSGGRPAAVSQHQLHHVARRLHAQRPGDATTESTTRPTAKATATATTTTTADNYGVEGPTRRRNDRDAPRCGRSRTCWPRCCSARACRCCCPATNAAARSAATTTPIARTTPSRGSIGGWWRRTQSLVRFVQALIAFRRGEPDRAADRFPAAASRSARRIARRELVQRRRDRDDVGAKRPEPDVCVWLPPIARKTLAIPAGMSCCFCTPAKGLAYSQSRRPSGRLPGGGSSTRPPRGRSTSSRKSTVPRCRQSAKSNSKAARSSASSRRGKHASPKRERGELAFEPFSSLTLRVSVPR